MNTQNTSNYIFEEVEKNAKGDFFLYRVNLNTEEDAEKWLQEYSKSTNTNWIVRNGVYEPQRLIYHKHFVCQHSCRNKIMNNSKRNTQCTSYIDIKVKKNNKGTRKNDPYLKRTIPLPGLIKMYINHNHSTETMLRMAEDMKEQFMSYFRDGLGVSESLKYHKKRMLLKKSQSGLSETATNSRGDPTYNMVRNVFKNWRKTQFGDDSDNVEEILNYEERSEGMENENSNGLIHSEAPNTDPLYVKVEVYDDTDDTIVEEIDHGEPETNIDDKSIVEQFIDANGSLWDKAEYVNNICDFLPKEETNQIALEENTVLNSQSHLEVHITPNNINCNLCKYSTHSEDNLNVHMDIAHSKAFKCQLCHYRANQKVHLTQHMKRFHLKLVEHKCLLCNYSTIIKGGLKTHINKKHSEIKTYKCYLCKYTSTKENYLKRHIERNHLKRHIERNHLNDKNVECYLCGFKTLKSCGLTEHMELVHLKIIKLNSST